MAKHHTITTIIGIVIALGAVHAARAQTPYSNGYNDGYADRIPLSGMPDYSTEYGGGWNAGQDDADEDFDHMMHRVDRSPSPTTSPPWSIQKEQELSDLREQLEDQRMATMSLETEMEIQMIHQEADAKRKSLVDELNKQPWMDDLQQHHPLPTTAELLQGLDPPANLMGR